jgi:predicted nucleic acid-binding protein
VIVLDASAAVEFLLHTAPGILIARRILSAGETLHAPYLIDAEVTQVLRCNVTTGILSQVRGQEALQDFADMRLRRYPHVPFLGRVWALRKNITAYDALYIALAERLDATLLTRDRKLAAVPGHRARVQVL